MANVLMRDICRWTPGISRYTTLSPLRIWPFRYAFRRSATPLERDFLAREGPDTSVENPLLVGGPARGGPRPVSPLAAN